MANPDQLSLSWCALRSLAQLLLAEALPRTQLHSGNFESRQMGICSYWHVVEGYARNEGQVVRQDAPLCFGSH